MSYGPDPVSAILADLDHLKEAVRCLRQLGDAPSPSQLASIAQTMEAHIGSMEKAAASLVPSAGEADNLEKVSQNILSGSFFTRRPADEDEDEDEGGSL